jgi:hypothetical protein
MTHWDHSGERRVCYRNATHATPKKKKEILDFLLKQTFFFAEQAASPDMT